MSNVNDSLIDKLEVFAESVKYDAGPSIAVKRCIAIVRQHQTEQLTKPAEIVSNENISNASEMQDNHCKDCCCARCWEALGITEYTGKSIPEHIAELRATREPVSVKDVSMTYCDYGENDSIDKQIRDILHAAGVAYVD